MSALLVTLVLILLVIFASIVLYKMLDNLFKKQSEVLK